MKKNELTVYYKLTFTHLYTENQKEESFHAFFHIFHTQQISV